jgi:hypothetical protein
MTDHRLVAKNLGLGKALNPAADRIVDMPSRHDHQKTSMVSKAAKEIVNKPVPSLVADRL